VTARRLFARVLLGAGLLLGVGAGTSAAQSVLLDGPTGSTLPSITPVLSLRAIGFGAARPLLVTVFIATTPDFSSGLIVDSTFTTSDSVVAFQVMRLLPSEGQVFWKARVSSPTVPAVESGVTGPRVVPPWLVLVTPNSPTGDIFDDRRPLFVWKSARVSPLVGVWKFDLDILTQGRAEQSATGLTDTSYRALTDLQTNASYRWSVRASLGSLATIAVNSFGSFLVKDAPLPPRTLMYQNFPNPFPSAVAFSTCIWFDVAEPGARIALDVTDLRGNLVRRLIPGLDGVRDFLPGQYGRGEVGAGSSCNNRFVWDGTGDDGRTVAPGVYLLRFQAGRQPPSFKRMLFLGR
jgi:hypothetical protein